MGDVKIINFLKKNKVIIIIVVLSLFLNLFQISIGLPYLWHPNEFVRFTLRMGKDFDLNPHWFINPSLPLYIVGAALVPYYVFLILFNPGLIAEMRGFQMTYDFLYKLPPDFVTTTFTIARIVTVLFAVGTSIFTYLICKKFFGKKIGNLAALFLAISPAFITIAHFATVDMYMIFFQTASIYFSLRIIKEGKLRDYMLAAVFAGFSIASKYTAGLTAVFIFIAHLLSKEKVRLKTVFEPKFLLACILVPASFIIGVPFSILSFNEFSYHVLDDILTRKQWGWRPFEYRAWFTNLHFFSKIAPGILLLICVVAFFYVIFKQMKKPNKYAIFLWSYVFSFYMLVGTWYYTTTRFILPIAPFVFIFAAIFLFDMIKKGKYYALFSKAAIVISIVWLMAGTSLQLYGYVNDPRYKEGDWIKANISSDESIVLFSQQRVYWPQIPREHNFRYDPSLWESNLSDEEFNEFVENITNNGPDYIILVEELDYLEITPYPEKTIFLRELMGGKLNYRIVARFDNPGPLMKNYKYLTKAVILKRVK